MYPRKYVFFFLFLTYVSLVRGQSPDPSRLPQKFIPLKPTHLSSIPFQNKNLTDTIAQLKAFLFSTNSEIDTSREEFEFLLKTLKTIYDQKGTSFSCTVYNSIIKKYNSICTIIDFLKKNQAPGLFIETSQKWYLQKLNEAASSIQDQPVIDAFRKLYSTSLLITTEYSSSNSHTGTYSTIHNQLEKIIQERNPHFSSLPIKKQLKIQKQVQWVNPWVKSFRKGITFNSTRETFLVEDNQMTLIPVLR